MFHMKRDLSGGAAVLAAMAVLGKLNLNINVAALIGAAENLVGTRAYKPGDIIRSMSGKTVEVLDTDAEGRLVLADLFTFIQKQWKLDCLIDIATLTGNISNALGSRFSGILCNDDDLFFKLNRAAVDSNDRIWRLPLEDSYRKHVKSHFADLKNVSSSAPDAILAALFLEEFIDPDLAWAHLDIASTDTHFGKASTYNVRGSTGVGTRLLLEFILATAESPDALCSDFL